MYIPGNVLGTSVFRRMHSRCFYILLIQVGYLQMFSSVRCWPKGWLTLFLTSRPSVLPSFMEQKLHMRLAVFMIYCTFLWYWTVICAVKFVKFIRILRALIYVRLFYICALVCRKKHYRVLLIDLLVQIPLASASALASHFLFCTIS